MKKSDIDKVKIPNCMMDLSFNCFAISGYVKAMSIDPKPEQAKNSANVVSGSIKYSFT